MIQQSKHYTTKGNEETSLKETMYSIYKTLCQKFKWKGSWWLHYPKPYYNANKDEVTAWKECVSDIWTKSDRIAGTCAETLENDPQ